MICVTPRMRPLACWLSLGLARSSCSVRPARKVKYCARTSGNSLKNLGKVMARRVA